MTSEGARKAWLTRQRKQQEAGKSPTPAKKAAPPKKAARPHEEVADKTPTPAPEPPKPAPEPPKSATAIDFTEGPISLRKAEYVNEILDEYGLPESKWTGELKCNSETDSVITPADGRKDWDCSISIRTNASPHALIHELLHARSISKYSSLEYRAHTIMEEGSVEYLAQAIALRKNIPAKYIAYEDHVNALRGINTLLNGGFKSHFSFGKELIDIPLPSRESYLFRKIKVWKAGTKDTNLISQMRNHWNNIRDDSSNSI